MKSVLEHQYERAVITKLCTKEMCASERADAFLDFLNNSEVYYDNLCDALLAASTGQNPFPIWFSRNGDSYSSPQKKNPEDHLLLYPHEVPLFDFDLIEQLEIAIRKIQLFIESD